MKTVFTLFLILFYGSIQAETSKALDTLYANETYNVALFFPKPIRQGITGAENFAFTFNRDQQQNLGLLQASPGTLTNLLVICNDGSVYSYILKYRKELSKLTYFLSAESSIGNEYYQTEVSEQQKNQNITSDSPMIKNDSIDYKPTCKAILNSQEHIRKKKKSKYGIKLELQNIVFRDHQLYFKFQLSNTSTLDYDLNFLKLYVQTKKRGKKKSMQSVLKKPIYSHQIPTKITGGATASFVVAYDKFSIAKDKRLLIDLNEANGERHIDLKVNSRVVNFPNT